MTALFNYELAISISYISKGRKQEIKKESENGKKVDAQKKEMKM
jgi:hypothetical protein